MKKILKHFWPAIYREKIKAITLVLTVMTVVVIDAQIPYVYKDFAQILAQEPIAENISKLSHIFLRLLFIFILLFLSWRLIEFCSIRLNAKGMYHLEQKCFSAIQKQSMHFFEHSFSGSLVRKAGRFVRAYDAIIDWFVYTLINRGTMILVTLTIFIFNEPLFGFIFFIWSVFFIFGNIWFALWKLPIDTSLAKADSKIGALFADTFSNISSVKTFSKEEEEQKRVALASDVLYDKRMKSWGYQMMNFAVQAFFMLSLELMLVFFMMQKWKEGEFHVENFVFFQAYTFAIFHRLWDFGRSLRTLFTAVADATEMTEILDTEEETQERESKELRPKGGHIQFQNIEFSYSDEKSQFHNFSLDIPSGQSVALVGHTGAGKTTITKLLFRFFEIQKGKILIDGQNIAKVTQHSLRSNISLVPQQPELFHRTIAENIGFGKINATEKEIYEAGKKAHALEFIQSLEQGFETLVGERGVKLSGGEKQRVAIARAFLENAPILILDEATSALDSITEKKIQAAIKKLIQDRTSIVIAHRLSTILQMDRIIVLENGKIIEDGSHEQLIKKEGVYASMWKHQAGGFLEE